ncbi:MAG: hypothetical protein ACPGVD_06065 [Flavobacteriales bacterium]
MKLLIHIFITVSILMVGQVGLSQNDSIIDEIEARGKGKRVIKSTPKSSLSPKLIENEDKTQIKSDFLFYEYTASSEFQLQPIKAAKLSIDRGLDKLKRGYVKAGIGMYTTPLLEVYYNSLRSKKSSWGIHGRHISSSFTTKNQGFSGLSENKAGAFYQHYNRKNYWRGSVNYERDVNHFYGFALPEDSTYDRASTKQAFNNIGASIMTSTFDTDTGDINYVGSLGYYNYSDQYSSMENNVLLDIKGSKMINSEIYGVDFGVDFNNYSSIEQTPFGEKPQESLKGTTNNNTIVKVVPNITTSGKKWYVRAGIGIYADIQDKTNFHFYPNIEAKYNFLDIFIPYLGVNGGLQRNSFKSLSQENPFILSQVNLQNTNTKYNVYGGIRGSITNTLTFNLQAARKKIFGQALFYNDTTYSFQNRMDVLYDTMDVTELNAQFTYQLQEKFRLILKGKYSFFSPLNQEHVWNIPALDITFGGVYDLADKILVRADIFFIGDRKAKSLTFIEGAELNNDNSYTINQKAFVDFNLGFEYRYSKSISAFLNFNNIIGQKYLRYHLYPVQGINILGGATFRF